MEKQKEEEKKEEIKSGMLIRFLDVGSAMFDIQIIGQVTPMQTLMIGEYLNMKARTQIVQMENKAMVESMQPQQQENKIVTPRSNIRLPDRDLKR